MGGQIDFNLMMLSCNNIYMSKNQRPLTEFEHQMYEHLCRFLSQYYRALSMNWEEENDKKDSENSEGESPTETDGSP